MERYKYNAIKELIDLCWKIRRANIESGDIAAGQYLHNDFEKILDKATAAFGVESISDR